MNFCGLKKIFGLFAAAALAATGLTCCGGGGGGNDELSVQRFCYKKITIQAPGPLDVPDEDEGEGEDGTQTTPEAPGGSGPAFSGSITIKVLEKISDMKAEMTASFGADISGVGAKGTFEVVGGTPEAPMVTFYFDGGMGTDDGYLEWCANFIPDDFEKGDELVGIPAPYVTFDAWTSKTSGLCTVTFKVGNKEYPIKEVPFEMTSI